MAKDNNVLVIALIIIIVLFIFGGYGWSVMGSSNFGMWQMMLGSYGYNPGYVFAWIFHIVFFVAFVLLIVWLIKQIEGRNR